MYLSPKAVWTLFSERKIGEVAFLKKKKKSNYHLSHLSNPLVKLLLEGSVYNKCLVSRILQFHRPWQLGMKSSGIMSIINEYAIYILIKLCTSGVKECRLEHPSYSVYTIVVYLNSPPLVWHVTASPPKRQFVTLHHCKKVTALLGGSNRVRVSKSKGSSQIHLDSSQHPVCCWWWWRWW